MMMTLHQAAAALQAFASADAPFDAVDTDSRQLRPGAMFVALRGDRFDGHSFVDQAFALGAAAVMVDRKWFDATGERALRPTLVVDDTRLALGSLAAHWRKRFDIPMIGITGSNGKTTVKEMCASILRARAQREGFGPEDVLATSGNFNNDIGLPLTLSALRDHHRAAVIEMGMNRPGEIAYLTRLAKPTVALVNNAQRAHLEGVGTLSAVAEEKGTIYAGLGSTGIAVVNADDPHADYWRDLNHVRRVVTFGFSPDADVRGMVALRGLGAMLALDCEHGQAQIELHVPGMHNAANALAAAACCIAAGANLTDVTTGLTTYSGVKGRLQCVTSPSGALILDDTYNANPDSVRAGVDVLVSTPGRTILVFGDMGEVGETSAQLHDEIGGYAKSKGVDMLYALGDQSAVAARNFGEGGNHYKTAEALVSALSKQLDKDTVVLVKGSRFMKMERVVALLVAVHNSDPSKNRGAHAA